MNRAIKQEKIKKELKLNDEKSKRILSDFERKKHSDLSNLRPKSDILFSINERQKTKKRTDNIKNESLYQIESKPKQINHFQNFSKLFSKNRKNETDDFSDYIMRKRSEKSWSNTKEYLMKTQVEKMQNEIEKIRKISEERDLQLKERQLKEEEIRKKQEDKERRILEKIKLNEDKQSAKKSLDDYLFKKTKKRSWFFAESDVNRDLKSRNK